MTTAAPLSQLVRHLRQRTELHPFENLTDAELLERFRTQGDVEAFAAIIRRHGLGVLAACRKVLTSDADVEDVFQAVFVVLLRGAAAIRRDASLASWLYGVAHRLALKTLEADRRRRRAEQHKLAAVAGEPDLSLREACAILHEELDRLPDQYRLPLLLCHLEGLSRDEAAQRLGWSFDVLRGRLERGRDRLRRRLTRRGVTLSAGLLAAVAGSGTAGVLPDRLLQATLAALQGQIPLTVAALLRSVTSALFLGKCQLLAVVLLVGLISGGIGLTLSGAPPAPEPPTRRAREGETPAETRSIPVSGKVVGPDGKPVSGAKLFVFDSAEPNPAPQKEARADGGFTFDLSPLAGGRTSYRYLVATAPHLGLGCDWTRVATATEPLRDAVLRLPRDEPIRGRIVDLEGRPVAGASVRVTNLGTGEDGTLDTFLRLWAPAQESQRSAYGAALAKHLYAPKALAGHFSATTDAAGRFTLRGIGLDRCPHLTVRARGLASQVCVVPLRPDFKPPPGVTFGTPFLGPVFTLPLKPSKPVHGVVRDSAGKPLAGVRVLGYAIESVSGPRGIFVLPQVETVTDAQGRYLLDGLPQANRYSLLADPKPGLGPTHQFSTRTNDAPGLAPLTADFALPSGVVLTGRLTDGKTGRPVRGFVFYCPLLSNAWLKQHPGYDDPNPAPSPQEGETWTDGEGRFRLTAVPGPGLLHVQVLGHEKGRSYLLAKLAPEDDNDEIIRKLGGFQYFQTSGRSNFLGPDDLNAYRMLRIPADAKAFTADLTVDPGVQRTVKIVGPDDKPVDGAWVLNVRPFGGYGTVRSGAEVQVEALDPDRPRRIFAQHDDRKLAGFLILDGKDTGPAVLKLQPTATVTGRILDAEGRPLKDVRIRPVWDNSELGLLLRGRDAYLTAPTLTGADGRFTRPNVPAGVWEFAAQKKGNRTLGPTTGPRLLWPGKVLDLGDWKLK